MQKRQKGIPYANVYVKGTQIGTTTDFDGYYELSVNRGDSIVASFVGYKLRTKVFVSNTRISFQLESSAKLMEEIIVYSRKKKVKNPAWPIIREIIKRRKAHDESQISAYEYDAYTKIEVDVDNISDKFKNTKLIKDALEVMSNADSLAGEQWSDINSYFYIRNHLQNLPHLKSSSKQRRYYPKPRHLV